VLAVSHETLAAEIKKLVASGQIDADELDNMLAEHGSIEGWVRFMEDQNRKMTLEIEKKIASIHDKL
jgi:metal-dependent amidase/aminoacylase/carboxypeptidase family protein